MKPRDESDRKQGKNMISTIDKSTQEELLFALDGLPPLSWLCLCETEDQTKHWQLIKDAYQITYDSLARYFEGSEAPLQNELALAQRDYYLSLYAVIQQGWRHIRIAAHESGIKGLPASPGEGLIRIIELDCAAFFSLCLSPYEWSSDSAYQFYRLGKQVREISLDNPTKSEQLKLKKYSAKLKKMQQPYQDILSLKNFCLATCFIDGKGESLRLKLENFEKVSQHLDNLIGCKLRKAQSYRWDDAGKKRVGTLPGGIYT